MYREDCVGFDIGYGIAIMVVMVLAGGTEKFAEHFLVLAFLSFGTVAAVHFSRPSKPKQN